MKKSVVVILLVIIFTTVITGCSRTSEIEVSETASAGIKENADNYLCKSNAGLNEILEDVVNIKITDVAENMYKEPLDISLSEEDVKLLISALNESKEKEDSFDGYLYYSLEMLDADGVVIEQLTIDTHYTAEFQNGLILERSGELDSVLENIETKYNITTDIWSRQPAEGYFSLFNLADHGSLDEITENNFIKGINHDISKEECLEIEKDLKEFEFSESPIDIMDTMRDMKYHINIYSQYGGGLYHFYIDMNHRVFIDSGYQVKSDLLSEYIESICGAPDNEVTKEYIIAHSELTEEDFENVDFDEFVDMFKLTAANFEEYSMSRLIDLYLWKKAQPVTTDYSGIYQQAEGKLTEDDLDQVEILVWEYHQGIENEYMVIDFSVGQVFFDMMDIISECSSESKIADLTDDDKEFLKEVLFESGITTWENKNRIDEDESAYADGNLGWSIGIRLDDGRCIVYSGNGAGTSNELFIKLNTLLDSLEEHFS